VLKIRSRPDVHMYAFVNNICIITRNQNNFKIWLSTQCTKSRR